MFHSVSQNWWFPGIISIGICGKDNVFAIDTDGDDDDNGDNKMEMMIMMMIIQEDNDEGDEE